MSKFVIQKDIRPPQDHTKCTNCLVTLVKRNGDGFQINAKDVGLKLNPTRVSGVCKRCNERFEVEV